MEENIKNAIIITILILFVMFLVFRIDFIKNIVVGTPAVSTTTTTAWKMKNAIYIIILTIVIIYLLYNVVPKEYSKYIIN